MSDAPQGDGWWQASDGNWYPPDLSTLPPPPAPAPRGVTTKYRPAPGAWKALDGKWYPQGEPSDDGQPYPFGTTKPSPKWVVLAIIGVVVLACALAALGISQGGDSNDEAQVTAFTVDVPIATTPTLNATQEQSLIAEVNRVYPGVPEKKIADWAEATCSMLLDTTGSLSDVEVVQMQFAGGTRPDPTTAQATAILTAITASGFCV